MKIGAGEMVAVQGIGGLGHLAIQYAAKLGYRIVAISRGSEKEAHARQLGAHEYIDTDKCDAGETLKQLGGASLIVTTSPRADTISPLLTGLGIFGKLLMLSVPGDVTINTGTMVSLLLMQERISRAYFTGRSFSMLCLSKSGPAVLLLMQRRPSSSPSYTTSIARLKNFHFLEQTMLSVSFISESTARPSNL